MPSPKGRIVKTRGDFMGSSMKPAAAIFILVVMVLSVAAFSLNSATFQQQAQEPEIPTIIREPITVEQQISVLRSGRVLIEYYYPGDCAECLEKGQKLEDFAHRLEGYVVVNEVSEVAANESRLGMIGANGRIVDISNQSLEYEDLLETFCDIAIAQPRMCIIREI
jgi:hypothetical protein